MNYAKKNNSPFVINIIGERSNVGKTTLIEGLKRDGKKRI